MGIAIGRSQHNNRQTFPHRCGGFTLIELLVVVGMIFMLVALLMPAISRVREMAYRTKCTSNLSQIGKVCHVFADLHNGRFPACYRMRDDITTSPPTSYPYYVPFCISPATPGKPDQFSNDTDPNCWQVYGTSWVAWQACGATLELFTCPSSQYQAYMQDLTNAGFGPWGAVIWTDYVYVGELTPELLRHAPNQGDPKYFYAINGTPFGSVNHWGTALPAVSATTTFNQIGGANAATVNGAAVSVAVQTQTQVLAADLVYYAGSAMPGASGPTGMWQQVMGNYRINHPQPNYTGYTLPDFQNILYADGSVSPHGQEDYFQALNSSSTAPGTTPPANWSMMLTNNPQGTGGYLYWGENEALPQQ